MTTLFTLLVMAAAIVTLMVKKSSKIFPYPDECFDCKESSCKGCPTISQKVPHTKMDFSKVKNAHKCSVCLQHLLLTGKDLDNAKAAGSGYVCPHCVEAEKAILRGEGAARAHN
jgi:hypothetical protein